MPLNLGGWEGGAGSGVAGICSQHQSDLSTFFISCSAALSAAV